MEKAEKVRENLIRRKLKRMGYELSKSKRRDPDAIDYGQYLITDQTGGLVWGGTSGHHDLTIEDVEGWIRDVTKK